MSNNEKEKTPFNAQKSLREVHLSTLAGQSNIYCSCLIPSKDDGSRRAERILVSTLSKNFRIYSASSNDVEYQEKMYAYLPQGCEIISIDLFRDDESDTSAGKNLITGVTWSSAPNSESISSYFLNTYESNLNYDTLTCISSIEFLDWIPFQITHCKLNSSVSFVVSGSDCRIHMFKKDLSSREYSESTTSELEADLPEFAQPLDSVALWVAFQYLKSTRITAIAQECGKLLVFIINTDDNSRVVQKHTFGPLEGPLTKVSFFRDSANLVVVFALVPSRVFYNVIEHGLEKSSILPLSDEFDVPTCCTLADIDFDGKEEILIGTYGEELLVYKSSDEIENDGKWTLNFSKSFNNPIHAIFHLDLTNDGMKELSIVTVKTVIVLQHDVEKVVELCRSRYFIK